MKHLLKAVFTMTMFTIIDRVLGFFFKIYLSRELGAVNMGVYQVALSIFFMLLTVTTSGLPLIVSKVTAKFRAKKEWRAERGTVSAALLIGTVSAVAVCGVILLCSRPLSKLFASPESLTLLLLLLPGVLFSGIYSAFRGNLWGQQKYATVSAIEVLEQVARVIVCVLLFLLGFDKLKMTALSMSIACGVTAVACVCCYFAGKGRLGSPKGQIVPLLKSSAPVTVVRAAGSLVNSAIAVAVPFLLTLQGHSSEQAMYLFGSSIGMAMPLLFIPITVVGSLAYVMIPTLSAAYAENNQASMRRQIESALIFSIVIAAFFVPAFWVLGKGAGVFIYDNADAGNFLSVAAWLLIPLSLENIASSMLNSLDLEKQGFVNYMIGAAVQFAILFAFTKHFTVNVLALAMGVGLTVSSLLDIRCITRRTGIKLHVLSPTIKVFALIFPTALLTQTVYNLCAALPAFFALAIAALTGFVFIVLLSLVFGIVDLSLFFDRRKKRGEKRGKKPSKAVAPAE